VSDENEQVDTPGEEEEPDGESGWQTKPLLSRPPEAVPVDGIPSDEEEPDGESGWQTKPLLSQQPDGMPLDGTPVPAANWDLSQRDSDSGGLEELVWTNQDEGDPVEEEDYQTVIDDPEEVITIRQMCSNAMFRIPVSVGGETVKAVIDTAAEVTIISDQLYDSLGKKPTIMKRVILNTAGREMRMKGFVVGPVQLCIGNKTFNENVYVAPIEDQMLLGIDLMKKWKVGINIKDAKFAFEDEDIQMEFGNKSEEFRVSRVRVQKKVVIPPNTVKLVKCVLDQKLQDYMLEPDPNLKVIIPKILYGKSYGPRVCVINPTDNYLQLRKNRCLGQAEEVAAAVSVNGDNQDVEKTPGVTLSDNKNSQVVEEAPGAPEDPKQPVGMKDFPGHLEDLLQRSAENLDKPQVCELKKLLVEYQDVFARDELDLGNFTAIEHQIKTGDAKPVKQRFRRTPLGFAEEEAAHLQKMLKAKVIQPSVSEWASAPVLVRKRDGNVRWCVDYRALNAVTSKDQFPLPLVEECVDTLAGNQWFSKLDANSAYWQVKIAEEDRKKTAFTTKYGLFEFVSMAFGLCNAPATYSRVMNLVLRGLNWDIVLAFLDDILTLGKTFKGHLGNLAVIFERLRFYQLKLKPKKCVLFQKRVEFLGRWVSEEGIEMTEDHISVVKNWSTPTTTREVEQFLGLANYHRAFVKNYAQMAIPLYQITGKQKFKWHEEQQKAFECIKMALISPPLLALPNSKDSFILDTDASNHSIGAELVQVQDGQEKVVSYGSVALSKEQLNYCVTRKELLAIVRFMRQYRHYLLGRHFKVRTDHSSLTWLLRFKNPQGQLARWIEELSQYDYKVLHRKGADHTNADPMSRMTPEDETCGNYNLGSMERELQGLPCGGCPYCRKAHKNWSGFVQEVDDVVPLSKLSPDKEQEEFSSVNIVTPNKDGEFKEQHEQTEPAGEKVHAILVISDGNVFLEERKAVHNISKVTAGGNAGLEAPVDLKDQYQKDSELDTLLKWLKSGEEPSEDQVMLMGAAEKYLWINRDLFYMEDDLIWKKDPEDNGTDQLVVPQNSKKDVFQLEHDIPLSGHQGISRTKERLKAKYFWYRMSKDVARYVQSCEACNHSKKATRKAKCRMTVFHAGIPMEKVHIDFLGPLPKSPNGNEHILVMVDQFTKWVECVPLPSQTAEVTAQAAVNEFFSRFGCPLQIHSDQGRNFESKLFSKLCELLQIHKARTTPYRPSGNGQVERYNRTLMDAVRCYIGKNQNQWDRFVPQIAGALRSAVNRQTGFTPNMLMLGREINQPADLLFPTSRGRVREKGKECEDYVTELAEAIKTSHEVARTNLKSNLKRMKRDHDVKVLEKSYEEGDVVLMLDCSKPKGKAKKLLPPWKGPGVILTKLSPYLYRVQMRNKKCTANHDKLKRCLDRDLPVWLQKLREQGLLVNQKEKLYCLCRKPDMGEFMIQCEKCEEWYHGNCVHVTPDVAETISSYICPICKVNPAFC